MDLLVKAGKILIVDDTPFNVLLLEELLIASGYTNILTTTDPQTVLELHKKHHFDVILLDIRMPVMDGFDVMRALKIVHRKDTLPVIVITAQDDKETRHRALEFGAQDFVVKPFDTLEILYRLKNFLQLRILFNEHKKRSEILEEKVQERTKELQETRLEIVRKLGRAAEYRDNETGMHVVRMSKMSALLTETLGFEPYFVSLILQASPMHDVGKIGISDNILLKPGKLTDEEFKIMKTHAYIGYEILSGHDSDLLQLAASIAYHHHEKWDGSGYPRGLKAEEIPIEGRIIAICDVFDALISVRPYKKAWTVEKTMSYINDSSGKHFDPELVKAFNSILPSIINIAREYSDVCI
ncbi:MAG: response regulator [Leptospiraceae bacterium]|nr:response regulator [Leptospiraceae bacterium]